MYELPPINDSLETDGPFKAFQQFFEDVNRIATPKQIFIGSVAMKFERRNEVEKRIKNNKPLDDLNFPLQVYLIWSERECLFNNKFSWSFFRFIKTGTRISCVDWTIFVVRMEQFAQLLIGLIRFAIIRKSYVMFMTRKHNSLISSIIIITIILETLKFGHIWNSWLKKWPKN